MKKKLLIVESPAKAKTIGKYLGDEFVVKSSVGHIRDLPRDNGAIRIAEAGKGGWTFTPTYEVSKEKTKVVDELKAAVAKSSEIYLASDPDREGEAIAWHLKEVLGPVAGDRPFHRVTYNEITKPAVLKAVAEPRDIDMPRVDAQQARRILDRIVGYKVSPLLWKSIQCANNRTLSAGRVQSVALRLLVERQREIDAFVPEVYFLMGVEAKKRNAASTFVARLSRIDGEKPVIGDKGTADRMLLDLSDAALKVDDIKRQPKVRHALPPFTTSTLQQAASSVLGFSPGRTMKLAQELYEQGRITYMRTDSVNVSDLARAAAKEFIEREYGPEFYPEKPNVFKSKADAQGAHEAIRPTDIGLAPGSSGLDAQALKLYDLIWRRFIASQMSDAKTTVKTLSISAVKATLTHQYLFTASATEIDFEGFLKVMKLSLKRKRTDGEDDEDTDEVASLPAVEIGEMLDAVRWIADEKQTKGPSHYSEASLIKALEENGVGRPSTYAATIETLKAREYAKTEKKKLVPLERGIMVCDWLVAKLDSLFNVGYTAEMEAELDKVEEKGEPMNTMLSDFYGRFMQALAACAEPPPDREKFTFVFSLLSEISEWKPAKKVGKRVYDDQVFVNSVRRQYDEGRALSVRQLDSLVRVALAYSSQIADCENRLKDAGFVGNAVTRPVKFDDALVEWCFATMDRIGDMFRNPFLQSLRDQVERGKPLTQRQFEVLAKAVCENAGTLPDAAEVRARLEKFVPDGYTENVVDPEIAKMLDALKHVKVWREHSKTKSRRTFDDEGFIRSLNEQYARRRTLSARQLSALRRVVYLYRDQIPDYRPPESDEAKADS